jgi:type I restriction enzyme, S subunit
VQANEFIAGFKDYVSLWKANTLAAYRLQANDIVIARSGTVGRSCVIPSELEPAPIMSTNLIRLRLNEKVISPNIISQLFNGSRLIEKHKDLECRGSTRSFFTQKILSRLKIPVPPKIEQEAILDCLDSLQTQIKKMKNLRENALKEFDALLPAILDKAFKGEL